MLRSPTVRRSLLTLGLLAGSFGFAWCDVSASFRFRSTPASAEVWAMNSGPDAAYLGTTDNPLRLKFASPTARLQLQFRKQGYAPRDYEVMFDDAKDKSIELYALPQTWSEWLGARPWIWGVLALSVLAAGGAGYRVATRDRTFDNEMTAEELTFALHVRGLKARGFRVLRELGRGGMAIVYEVVREGPNPGAPMALKLLNAELSHDENSVARMEREIKIQRDMQHPGIVPLLDFGEIEGKQYYLVMEMVQGACLRDLLDGERFPVERTLDCAETVLDAVAYAHAKGILHRDLKPENVMIEPDGSTQVLDFGIARSVEQSQGNTFMTMDGSMPGTPAYMSPERMSGDMSPSSDQYALGLMFYEMLAGHHPIPNTMDIGMLMHHQLYVVPPPPSQDNPDVWPELDAWVLKQIAKAPEDRFSSVQEVREELRQLRAAHAGVPVAEMRASVGGLGSLAAPLERKPAAAPAAVAAPAAEAPAPEAGGIKWNEDGSFDLS